MDKAFWASLVRRGKDGYLFQIDEGVFDRLEGRPPMEDADLDQWVQLFQDRQKFASEIGSKYFMFVVPEKHVVYQEFLPNGAFISPNRHIIKILNRFKEEGLQDSIIYPLKEMELAKMSGNDPYPKGGSHWNGLGALIGYQEICLKSGITPYTKDDFDWNHEQVPGGSDLEERLDLSPGPYTMYHKKQTHGHSIYDNGIWTLGNVKVFTNSNSNLPSAVIFRDSFSMILLPLLSESFGRIVAVASAAFQKDILESEKPDFIITEIAERYVCTHPREVLKVSFEEYCKVSPEAIFKIGRS